MEVTRQLRHDLLNKKGLAPIALTFCWDGQRMREGSGEKCDPKHWNAKREEVKPAAGNFAATTNLVLDRYAKAAHAAHQATTLVRQVLPPEAMWAEIQRRYALLAAGDEQQAEEPELPPLPAPEAEPPGFFDYYAQWLAELEQKTSLTSGKGLSTSYLQSLANTRDFLLGLAAQERLSPTFAGMDADFYLRLSRFFFAGGWGRSINTFGKHVRHLKSFLAWAEDRDQPVNRKYAKWGAPDEYVGADALTEAELLDLAALDFGTAQARAYVQAQFEEFNEGLSPKKGLRRSQADPHRVAERLRMLALTRDKFLQCAYLGLRISDANALRPQQVEGQLVRLKTSKACFIP